MKNNIWNKINLVTVYHNRYDKILCIKLLFSLLFVTSNLNAHVYKDSASNVRQIEITFR